LRPQSAKIAVVGLKPVGPVAPRRVAVWLVVRMEYCCGVVNWCKVLFGVVLACLRSRCTQVDRKVILRRLVVGVVIDCFVDFDALLVVIENVLKHWDNLSNSAKASAFPRPSRRFVAAFNGFSTSMYSVTTAQSAVVRPSDRIHGCASGSLLPRL
jgi:hypothetical protein